LRHSVDDKLVTEKLRKIYMKTDEYISTRISKIKMIYNRNGNHSLMRSANARRNSRNIHYQRRVLVINSYFNFTKKSDLVGKLWYDFV